METIMAIYDEIQDLSDEQQEQFHRYVQRSLRRRWAKAKDKTERKIDDEQRKTRS